MPTGYTSTTSLADSLPLLVTSARQVRERPTGFMETCDRKPLGKGEGVAWREVVLGRLSAQSLGQLQRLDTPQEVTDTLFTIEPEIYGIHVILTRKVQDQIDRKVFGELSSLMQHAIQRRKHTDGLAIYDTSSFSQPGAGNTLTSGHLSAAVAQIQGNATEHATDEEEMYAWLHPYQVHDLQTEIGAAVGTYTIQPGDTQEAYERGARAITMVGGARIKRDGLVRIDANDDAHGGVHAKFGVVLVEWDVPDAYTKELEDQAGAKAWWLYDAYQYGERSSGLLQARELSDATAPTA